MRIEMSIKDKVSELVKQAEIELRKDTDFAKLEEFYKQAIESGIAKKPEYNLPQLDTIGTILNTQYLSHK